jgi:hypothetical protein
MNRRNFLAVAGGSLAMSMPAGAADSKPRIIELRRYQLRNTPDAMARRTTDFLEKAWSPALKRSGASVVGAFGSLISEGSPYVLLLSEYADMGAWESAQSKALSDTETTKMRDEYFGGPLQFIRSEVTLLRGFPGFPAVQVPPAKQGGGSRVYEIRTYESNNPKTLARKIRMFDEGESALFAKIGMTNVFYGETVVGRNMPNLTYMVGFDDLAHREKAWSAFGGHPEWKKMLAQPGVTDAEIVSNISNAIVRPLAWSAIK